MLYLSTILVFILVLVNVFFISRTANHDSSQVVVQDAILNTNNIQAFILPVSEASYLPILDTNIVLPSIRAKAAIVYDVNSSRHLFENNIDVKLPIASLTKILTAMVVVDHVNLKDIVTVSKEAIKVDGERQDLYLNERIMVEDLLKLMLIKSSNDAAYALDFYAKSIGLNLIGEMNSRAISLGMLNSHFKDSAGLNDEAYSSANDMVKLIRYSLNYPALWEIMSQKSIDIKSVDGIIHHIETTDQLLDEIPGVVGGKTGFTDDAMGCMILVVQVSGDGDRIITIVLGSSERFTDTKKLVDWTRQAYRWHAF